MAPAPRKRGYGVTYSLGLIQDNQKPKAHALYRADM